MTTELELYDVTIVGGGPAGLYAAFYSGMRDMKTKLIEAKDELGGRLLIYPEKMIWDVGGVTPLRCDRLIQQLVEQARTFDPTIVLGQQIVDLERLEDGTMVVTSSTGERHHTRTIILALGYGVAKVAKLELEGADRFEVTNLHYTVTDLESFRGKRVLLSGGGDTALDWAMELEMIAASVTVVHRRERFGGHEKNVRYVMESSSIAVHTPYVIAQLHGSGELIEAATIAKADENGAATEHTERIEVDAIIVNHGQSSDFGPIVHWGLEMDTWNIPVNARMSTNLPGIFAAGDSAEYPTKLRLIAGAFNDAALAVNGAKQYLEPKASGMAYVSSHNAVFNEKNKALKAANSSAAAPAD
jgi:thioredoxin reductase